MMDDGREDDLDFQSLIFQILVGRRRAILDWRWRLIDSFLNFNHEL